MRLTKFTDNALRVLIYAGANSDRQTNISEIAEKCGISRNHLTKVVHTMATYGLLETTRGKGGGIRLAHPSDEITVASVVRTMEPDLKIIECFDPPCPLARLCKLRSVLDEASNAFLSVLDDYTIADLIKDKSPLRVAGWV